MIKPNPFERQRLRENYEQIKEKKYKKRCKEFNESHKREGYLYKNDLCENVIKILLTNGCFPKFICGFLDNKILYYRRLNYLMKCGLLKTKNINKRTFITFNNLSEEVLDKMRKEYGDIPIDYYLSVIKDNDGGETKGLYHDANKINGRQDMQTKINYQTYTDRTYKTVYLRSLFTFMGIQSCTTERKPLQMQNNLNEIITPMFFSSYEVKRAMNLENEDVNKAIMHSRSNGIIIAPQNLYVCFNIENKKIRWTKSLSELYFAKKICDYVKKETADFVFFTSDIKTIYDVMNNNENTIVGNNLRLDYDLKKMYFIPISINGISHFREMLKDNWELNYIKRQNITFEEYNNAKPYHCDGVRENNNQKEFILNFCIPDVLKLNRFLKLASNRRKETKEKYVIYIYDYQLELLDYLGVYEMPNVEIRTVTQEITLLRG